VSRAIVGSRAWVSLVGVLLWGVACGDDAGGDEEEIGGAPSRGGRSSGGFTAVTGGRSSGGSPDTGGRSSGGRASSSGGMAPGDAGEAGANGELPGGAGAGGDEGSTDPRCEPLPPPTGRVVEVTVDRADELPGIVRSAEAGTTILLGDGTYRFSQQDEAERRLRITNQRVSLRGASGNRDRVVIDGEYATEEILTISASNVTVADLTILRAVHHPIHVTGGATGDITGTKLYKLRVVDGGEQFVKINTSGQTPNTYADDGLIECSSFEMTPEGREHVVPEPGGCYTGGIDGHQARGWEIRNNVFRGIHCENGSLAEHAIHFWTSSRDTLVEQNRIIDCARGIGFGLGDGGGKVPDRAYDDDPYPGVGYIGHYGGVIRNNMIVNTSGFEYFDTGIELEQARGTRVLHNTIVHAASAFASISYRFDNTEVTLANNLLQSVRERDGATATSQTNVEGAGLGLFVDPSALDFHLAPSATAAIDQGTELDDAGFDIDGDGHDGGAPDIGADEFTE
jgi:hypothetical protein